MRSPYNFIVTPLNDKRYNNTKKISNIDFITSTSQENHMASNREAVVVSVPITYKGPIKKGDILLVHHNVFKFYYDMKGRQRSCKSYYKDNLFFVDSEQFFMYKKNNQWFSYDRYCFVEPIKTKQSIIYKNTKEEPLVARMVYANKYLKQKGVKKNTMVSFKPESEYPFEVEGKKLYRMYDHQITMVV